MNRMSYENGLSGYLCASYVNTIETSYKINIELLLCQFLKNKGKTITVTHCTCTAICNTVYKYRILDT